MLLPVLTSGGNLVGDHRSAARGKQLHENGLVKPPRRDAKYLSLAGMVVWRKGTDPLNGVKEKIASTIRAYAQYACLLSLQLGL
jgi:hypothetical protein